VEEERKRRASSSQPRKVEEMQTCSKGFQFRLPPKENLRWRHCRRGGFTMMMGDFITLVQMGLPVRVIVLNNGTLGFVEMEMKANGFLDTGCNLQNPNFALMAHAMGVKGFRVEKPQELKSAIQAALAHKGPALVDVVGARQELAMSPKTTLDQAYHFGMFTMKAVLDGRAKERIDLAKTNLAR
jgi:pyruvate dehydrogenase (quinone)